MVDINNIPEEVVQEMFNYGLRLALAYGCPKQFKLKNGHKILDEKCKKGKDEEQCKRCWDKALDR